MIFLNILIIDSVEDNISSVPFINKFILFSSVLKSITLLFSKPPISSSKELCGSITTILYLFLLKLSFDKFFTIALISLDLPVPLAPITIECFAKS